MGWASTIPIHHMVTMLEAGFFPKWQQVLYHWLCSNPNFDEVTQWFLGWKGLLSPELLANERIRNQLNVGLEMMNQVVEGMTVKQPGARENVSYLRVTEQRQFEALQ
jgi:tuftelin-interacting protein 11